MSVFIGSSPFRLNGIISPRPPAGDARRLADQAFHNLTALILACGGTPTPSDADRYMATYEAERDAKERYFNCTTNIDNQVDLLEKNADTCSDDYDCRAKIAQQMEELADQLKSTCVPVQPDLSPDFNCKVRLIQARANFVHGAPNETGENRTRAEEAIANQVKDAYEYCFSLFPEPNP